MRWMYITAHPDDEMITTGSLLIDKGGYVILCTNYCEYNPELNVRVNIFSSIMDELKCPYEIYSECAYHIGDITERIRKSIDEYNPDMIVTHHLDDFNIDHRKVSESVILASRDTGANIIFMNSYAPERIKDFRGTMYHKVNERKYEYISRYMDKRYTSDYVHARDYLNTETFEPYRVEL